MSGIYIKGMKMPKSCVDCKVAVAVKDGVLCTPMFRIVKEKILSERQQDCPLIAVPDHGRLIDADCCNGYFYEHMSDDMMIAAMNAINEMPTIIPADKEEHT